MLHQGALRLHVDKLAGVGVLLASVGYYVPFQHRNGEKSGDQVQGGFLDIVLAGQIYDQWLQHPPQPLCLSD